MNDCVMAFPIFVNCLNIRYESCEGLPSRVKDRATVVPRTTSGEIGMFGAMLSVKSMFSMQYVLDFYDMTDGVVYSDALCRPFINR